ncbi:hypothetical protein EON65_52690 [archaeon]|nr:MAG: hypothetical protein EON65_52690 [archaeon]
MSLLPVLRHYEISALSVEMVSEGIKEISQASSREEIPLARKKLLEAQEKDAELDKEARTLEIARQIQTVSKQLIEETVSKVIAIQFSLGGVDVSVLNVS